jgi:hypothetical protein
VVSDDLVKQALAELGDIVRCRCHAAYTDRKLHDPDCNCDSAEALQIVSGCIEALQSQLAERDKACVEWAEVSQRHYQRAKTAEADRDQWRSMWEKEQTDNEQLQAQLADGSFYQEKDIDAMIDRAQRAEAQLAKAREDALREAAGAITSEINNRHYLGVLRQRDRKDLKFIRERILALLDTPTPAPSPDALVKAALEWAAKKIDARKSVLEVGTELSGRIRAAATDPATVAAIIERAGK